MRIVEEDFIMEPRDLATFDITFFEKTKDKETGEIKIKNKKAFGCTLPWAIKKIVRHRVYSKFESESVYLLEALEEIIKLEKEMVQLCREAHEG